MTAKFRSLRVAAAQPLTVPGDVPGNLDRMAALISDAGSQGAQAIAFSEGAVTGYDLQGVSIEAAVPSDHESFDRLAQLAADHSLVVIAGYYEIDGDTIYNSAAIIQPGGERITQRKHMIIAHEADKTTVQAGPRERTIFQVDGANAAVLICADSGMRGIYPELEEQGCDVVFSITAGCGREEWGYHQADLANADTLKAYVDRAQQVCFPAHPIGRVIEHGYAMVCCNQQGWVEGTGYFHPGHSFILDRTGEIREMIPGRFVFEHLRPGVIVADVSVPDRTA